MKNTKEFNKKIVGANCVRQKNHKGITLIALIITIIVMLILVGVTINVALNGGLFGKAKDAKNETLREMDKEELYSAVVASYDARTNTIIRDDLERNLGEEWTVSEGEAPWTCTSKNGNAFIVYSDGRIEDEIQEATLEDYLFGKEVEGVRPGRLFVGLTAETINDGMFNPNTMQFIQDQKDANSRVHENIKLADVEDGYTYYIRYNRNVYKFSLDENTYMTDPDSFDTVKEATGNLGKYVTLGEEGKETEWIVLSEDNNNGTVELISANALKVNNADVTLGAEEIAGEYYYTTFSRARTSYNGAIDTLNNACKAEVDRLGITGYDSVRCVGSRISAGTLETEIDLENYASLTVDFPDTSNVATADLSVFKWSTLNGICRIPAETIEKYEGATNGLRKGDNNYEADVTKMQNIGVLATDNIKDYWLASRLVSDSTDYVHFKIRFVYGIGSSNEDSLCYVTSDGSAHEGYRARECAVRPIITLQSSLIALQL